MLQKALHFIPGQRLQVEVEVESEKEKWQKMAGIFKWQVQTDVYNSTFIKCEKDGGVAYLHNNEELHYFTNFTGKEKTALYWFFLALFKVPLGFLPNSKISDSVPLNMMFGGGLKFLQDFIAPAALFLKADYQLILKEAGDILSSRDLEMNAEIVKKIAGKPAGSYSMDIKIGQESEIEIQIIFNEAKIKIKCQNESES